MTAGGSTFGALGSKSQVFAQWLSLTLKIGGSFSKSIFIE